MGVEVLTDLGGRLARSGIARAPSKNRFSRLPPLPANADHGAGVRRAEPNREGNS